MMFFTATKCYHKEIKEFSTDTETATSDTDTERKVKNMFGKKKAKTVVGTHISGLDIPENVNIIFTLDTDGVVIKIPSSKEYSISLNKIQSISFYNETEIQNITTSSLGSAVIGAAAFGTVGAIIGSRAKNKEQRTVLFYLLIQYDDNAIVIESKDGFSVGQVVDYFKKLKPSRGTQRIEL